MKRREKINFGTISYMKHFKDTGCDINVKHNLIHEIKKIKYAIIIVNYATTSIKQEY